MIKFVCSQCGGSKIEEKMWVNPNTKKINDSAVLDEEDRWCNDCQEHVDFVNDDEYQRNKE